MKCCCLGSMARAYLPQSAVLSCQLGRTLFFKSMVAVILVSRVLGDFPFLLVQVLYLHAVVPLLLREAT